MKLTDKKQSKITRGIQAKALIDNPLLNEVLDTIEKQIDQGWKSDDSTPDKREESYMMYCALQDFKARIKLIAIHGKNAATELENQQGKNDHV